MKLSNLLNGKSPVIIGVLNITPDSFSDGGVYNTLDRATIRAEQMLADGADIIDVGGESSRPCADIVSVDEELSRVIPVIETLKEKLNIPISIDTVKHKVMREALLSGAVMVNDISALSDINSIKTVVKLNATVCLMHMQGKPQNMQKNPYYNNVVLEVFEFLKRKSIKYQKMGIKKEAILIDPGFGFGKSYKHNVSLLKNLNLF